MPPRLRWPDELPDVFLGSAAVAEGVLTPKQLRDPRLRRLFHDVYAPAHLPHDHALACRGAALIAPGTARLTGRSMATVLGVRLADRDDPVEFVVPHPDRTRDPKGIALRAASRGPLGTATWRGVAITTPERMGFDLAAKHPLEDGVAHLDAVVGRELLGVSQFQSWLQHRHEDHVVHVREAAQLIDGRAGSPPESKLRVRLVRADLGVTFTPQHVVRNASVFVARVDLAVVDLKVAVEYEGAWHGLVADQLAKDRRRLDALREAGWIVVHVTADMMRTPGMAVDAVRRALAERAA
ncbi:MAG: hypothetical protein PGN11_14890 [Quadrisphaera sp.]